MVSKRTISLLTSDVNTRKLVGVSREGMEETLKNQNIIVKDVGKEIKRNVEHLVDIRRGVKSSSKKHPHHQVDEDAN